MLVACVTLASNSHIQSESAFEVWDPITISGDNPCKDHRGAFVFCNGDALTLTAPNGNSYSWSITEGQNRASLSGQVQNTITLTAASGGRGYVTVMVTYTDGPNINSGTLRFWVGKPDDATVVNGNTNVVHDALEHYNTPPVDGACSYEWRLPYPYTTDAVAEVDRPSWGLRPFGPNDVEHSFMSAYAGPQDGLVQAIPKNPCGSGGAATLFVTTQPGDGGNGGGNGPGSGPSGPEPLKQGGTELSSIVEASVFPNPANGRVILQIEKAEGLQHKLSPNSKLLIRDIHGRIVRSEILLSFRQEIDIQDVPSGIYLVSVPDLDWNSKLIIE